MMLELYPFQKMASDTIADRFMKYRADPIVHGTKQHPRVAPFFQALASVTASGKTVILADAVATIATLLPVAPVVLWLSKGKVVVDQTYANLTDGGKYYHLLGQSEVKTLAEYDELEVRDSTRMSLYLATVGTFNQRDKEQGSRLIFKSDIDTQSQSTWDALKSRATLSGAKRTLIVVYDEAHNLSDQQTNLLMELEPDAFLVASATMRLPQRMIDEIALLKQNGWDEDLTTTVDAKQVAESGLIKSTLVLAGYNAPMEETLEALLRDMQAADADALSYGLTDRPKAIYVCRTNIIEGNAYQRDDPSQPFNQRQSPPILIWRYLVEKCHVNPEDIAVYCSLSFKLEFPPPTDFHLYKGGDSDFATFSQHDYRHVIFNLSLQEGWDDPYCYFAYVDKSMDSPTQVEQIIGRLLRQPDGKRLAAERLNTAHFYIRVDKNRVFNELIDAISLRLSSEAPTVRVIQSPPDKPKVKEYAPKTVTTVAETAIVTDEAGKVIQRLLSQFSDYSRDSGDNTRGVGSRRLSIQQIGENSGMTTEWEEYQQSSLVSVRWVFQREVRRLMPNALGVAPTSDSKFDTMIGIGSHAFVHTVELASNVIDAFVDNVYLRQRRVDPYTVGPILARENEVVQFQNALHEGYSNLNSLELAFARALDRSEVIWCRNPSQIGYGIPLISVGRTHTFFPDFLIWRDDTVIALDTTGGHLLPEKAVRKLLRIEPPKTGQGQLYIHFVSEGHWNKEVEQLDTDGYTVWGIHQDYSRTVTYASDLDEAVNSVIEKH